MATRPFALLTATLLLAALGHVRAEPIYVPNASFELPVVSFVGTNMVSWETFPPQDDGEIGVFLNNPAYGPAFFIVNCDGNQAAYIFADPGLALFQDYDSVDSSGAPSTNFTATFEVGKAYELQAGLIGGDQGAAPGVILQMSLYYRDSSSNMVIVAATNIVYDTNVFTSITNFTECELDIPVVQATDPWAGQHIGIQFLSIVPSNVNPGGDWDLDNVQLSETQAPTLINPARSNGQFSASVQGDPGVVFQILSTTNLSTPLSHWTRLGTLTNVSGTTMFIDPSTNSAATYYQAVEVPQP